jgi:hypothetical protein
MIQRAKTDLEVMLNVTLERETFISHLRQQVPDHLFERCTSVSDVKEDMKLLVPLNFTVQKSRPHAGDHLLGLKRLKTLV